MGILKSILLKCIFLFFSISLIAGEGQIASANGIEIWYETFGQKDHPPLLLIMGGCCQGIMWPSEFCERLAEEGFYVIRYDHRDTGYSTCFDSDKNPYNLMDLMKDALGLLDALKVKKAHLCGLSMGGPIAELLAVHYPERVETITLIATSCDFRPMNLAYQGLPAEEGTLTRTKDVYLSWMNKFLAGPPKNQEEALEQRMSCWHILNGSVIPFEEDRYEELHRLFLSRSRYPESIKNHVLVCLNSEELVKTAPGQVKVPCLIIHGTEDPILPPDHGEALAKAISGSEFLLVQGMGHVPNCHFYDLMIKGIKRLTKHN
jgi:pimeloyl-ACP methyl ester carboxylesterase